MDLNSLPKVELHLHLDCSLSYDVVKKIDPAITQEEYNTAFISPPKCPNLADYITRAVRGVELMQTREQLRLVTLDLFDQLKKDNVIYAEVRFAPLLHTQKGLTPQQVVEAVNAATAEGIAATGVQARLILCTLRHFSETQSMETVELVKEFRGTLVAGFDIAADEAGYPIDAHRNAFAYAKTNGLFCTAHAGEAKGPESVWETLDNFHPSRIGHGVRSSEDSTLLAHLLKEDIHLEICPTSNIQTDIYPTYKEHTADKIHRSGVSMSINTDARTISNTTLTKEYGIMAEHFNWKKDQFYRCNMEAIRHAFIPEEEKAKLRSKLAAGY